MRKNLLFISLAAFTIFSCDSSEEKKPLKQLTSKDTVKINSIAPKKEEKITEEPQTKKLDIEKVDLTFLNDKLTDDDTIGFFKKTYELYEFNKTTEVYKTHYHYYDIDQDGDLDLLYDGWSGSEPMFFEISMNVHGTFKKQFYDYVYLKEIFFSEDGKLDSLIINDIGCCAAMTKSYRYYKMKISKDSIVGILRREEVFHHAEERPTEFFTEPIAFEILNPDYWLRITPKIDTSNWFTEEWRGNRFVEFHEGDQGIALAEKSDSTGRVWWYSKLPYRNTTVHGWMSSRFVKTIDK